MTAPDSLAALLNAAAETGATIAVPGLLDWLGVKPRTADSDFQASIDGGFTESFEAYCDRISKADA